MAGIPAEWGEPMKGICLVDTSIFVQIVNVPFMSNDRPAILEALKSKLAATESLFLPMATIIETGNHIGQNGDGRQKRACAIDFVKQVELAIDGKSPFTALNFLEAKDMRRWLAEFPNWAMRGSGLGDLSIVHDWERIRDQNEARRVYIWSLDEHLAAYDTGNR